MRPYIGAVERIFRAGARIATFALLPSREMMIENDDYTFDLVWRCNDRANLKQKEVNTS
jgi:hypothetical protein